MAKANRQKTNDIIFLLLALVLGLLLGWVTVDLTGHPAVYGILRQIGLWVFATGLFSLFARTGLLAAGSGFGLMLGVKAAGLLHLALAGTAHLGFWVVTDLIFCLLMGIVGFIAYSAREKRWLGALCGSIPVSLLVAEMYPRYGQITTPLLVEGVAAVVLFVVLLKGKERRLMALPFLLVISFLLCYFDVLGRLPGGML